MPPALANNRGFVIRLLFDQRKNGRVHVHSPDMPGLHLAGASLDKIRGDVEPILKDLLFHNMGMIVDKIEWFPPIDQIAKDMAKETAPDKPRPGDSRFLVILGRAA